MARRRRRERPDPWQSENALDAILVKRAERMERLGDRGRHETTAQLLGRLGFDSIADMRLWAAGVCDRIDERHAEVLRRREAGEKL